jgi:hypothetical protein
VRVPPNLFLIALDPPEQGGRSRLRVGQRVRWPGDDTVWVWNGEAWVGERTAFDGGDLWELEDLGDDEQRGAA